MTGPGPASNRDSIPLSRGLVHLILGGSYAWTFVLTLGMRSSLGDRPLLTAAIIYTTVIGLVLAVTDFKTHRLPNAFIWPSYGILAALLVSQGVITQEWSDVVRAALVAAATLAVFFLLHRYTSLGLGDVKLAGMLAIPLGWSSWTAGYYGPALGFLLGAVAGIVVLIATKSSKTHLAFGPYLVAGALLLLYTSAGS